jgi:hypothetical protein
MNNTSSPKTAEILCCLKNSKHMSVRANWCIATVAIAFFVAGVVLSHRVEPGVHVKTVTLAGDTPALQFTPLGPGPHPVALLAHGYTGSKENLFFYGEALAAAGFVCFDVDLPGHGASPRFYSFVEAAHTLEELARAIGPVDVFVGHSMGGAAGGEAVRDGGMKPKLFIAVGSLPRLGEHAPPLLLLAGRFDEFVPPAELKARTDAHLVLSPWSNHGLEAFDPVLVNVAVEAACAMVGKTPPAAPTCWRWRFAGVVLAMLGALGLSLCLPKLPSRWAGMRGLLVPATFISAFILTVNMWFDVKPHLRHFPLQMAAAAIALFVLLVAGRLRIPRWSLLALATVVWIGCAIAGAKISIFHVSLFQLVPWLFEGMLVGAIAAYRGSRRDGNIAMVIIMVFILFQWGQPPRTAPEAPQSRVAIKLDAKLCDACVGHYEFPPDNVFRNGMKLTIWRQGNQLAGQFLGTGAFQGVVDIYPESETNFFLTINGKQNGEQLTFIKDDKGEVTAVIDCEPGFPVFEGKKLKNE